MSTNDPARLASRRSFLTGTTAAIAGAGAGAIPALAFPAGQDDAELEAVVARYHAASAAHDAADRADEEAGERYYALGGPPDIPEAVFVRDGDNELSLYASTYCRETNRHLFSPTFIESLRRRPRERWVEDPHPTLPPPNVLGRRVPWPEAQARADEIVAAWDARSAEIERRQEASGYAASGKAERAAFAEYEAAREALVHVQARTMRGVMLKVGIVLRWYLDDPEDLARVLGHQKTSVDYRIAMAVLRDLDAMGAA